MKKDNLTDVVESLPREKPAQSDSDGNANQQVLTNDGEVITLARQAVDKFLEDRKNKGKNGK